MILGSGAGRGHVTVTLFVAPHPSLLSLANESRARIFGSIWTTGVAISGVSQNSFIMKRLLRNALVFVLVVLWLAACDSFLTRTPEDPIMEGGTYVQPDAPDAVVANLRASVAELNAANYRRSLDEDIVFEATASARARDPSLWSTWGRAEENGYFTTMTEAARNGTGHMLRLTNRRAEFGNSSYLLDAQYFLVVHHGRLEVPDTVQGRLLWDIAQGGDGLWSLRRWTDQQIGLGASWSDLKAEFAK